MANDEERRWLAIIDVGGFPLRLHKDGGTVILSFITKDGDTASQLIKCLDQQITQGCVHIHMDAFRVPDEDMPRDRKHLH